jgi:hypothetical protein
MRKILMAVFYSTVGVALTNDTSSFGQTVGFTCNPGVVDCTSKSDWHAGPAAGAGMRSRASGRIKLCPNISASNRNSLSAGS